MRKISRKDFLKGTTALLASSFLAGCAANADTGTTVRAEETAANTTANPTAATDTAATGEDVSVPEAKPEYDWANAADLVVVGGGGAGFCAAIEAARAGASVLILEKGDLCGGDTLLSGGMIMVGGTNAQKTLGAEDTPENFAKTELGYCGQFADPEMVEELCNGSQEVENFMVSLGRKYTALTPMKPVWGYDNEETWAPRTIHDNESREGHFAMLQNEAAKYDNIQVQTATTVEHLITDDSGAVIGVKDSNGNCYRANKGVVLSTASFGHNIEMSKRYNFMNYWALRYEEVMGVDAPNSQCANNTGDGIRMAQEIGADLALSTANCISDVCSMSFDSQYGSILVNDQAKRFVQENAHWGYLNSMVYQEAIHQNAAAPETCRFYLIADQNAATKNIYLNFILDGVQLTATENYMKRVLKADTLEELAEMADLPKDSLQETVAHWNEMVATGEDTDFGRKDIYGSSDLVAIGDGPYYAFPYVPYSMGSFGGLRTNKETQVLSVFGEPIPRLFAAGAIMSGMFTAPFYNACGWSVLGTVHWGRKAGKNIAALEAWTTEEVTAKEISGGNIEEAIANATGSYNAGIYNAVGQGRNGEVSVEVEFNDRAILRITIGENQETPGIGDVAVQNLPDRILLAQSAEVDVYSGATMTSTAILEAVKDCIAQASN